MHADSIHGSVEQSFTLGIVVRWAAGLRTRHAPCEDGAPTAGVCVCVIERRVAHVAWKLARLPAIFAIDIAKSGQKRPFFCKSG